MILEEMYSGRFYPCETVVPTSEVYRKAVKACENLMEQLSQRLSKEDYELVKELRAQTAIVVSQNKVPVSCTKTANYYISSIMMSLCTCL